MNEYSKLKSFSLMLEPYCEYCGDFSAYVNTIDCTTFRDIENGEMKHITTIQCENAEKCARLMNSLKNRSD